MKPGRFILVVLDSFGVGEMDDVKDYHPFDQGANTAYHVLNHQKLEIDTLESLGLINTINKELKNYKKNNQANIGISKLEHKGADSFLGHQEIMGSKYKQPIEGPFSNVISKVEKALLEKGYQVRREKQADLELLVVNESVTIGDNLETDGGRVYNVTGSFDLISFEELKKIGYIVREVVAVARVIVFGGINVTFDDLKNAIRTVDDKFIGVDAPLSKVYKEGYQVIHLGYGVNPEQQIQSILAKANIPVYLYGKFADVILLDEAKRLSAVDTDYLFEEFNQTIKENDFGLFCLNIQETDLAGHAQDVSLYGKRIEKVDRHLKELIGLLNYNDVLIVTADHGNDPTIGHSNHTREYVPLLIKYQDKTGINIGVRKTMSDTAATIAEYFNVDLPENGLSFCNKFVE